MALEKIKNLVKQCEYIDRVSQMSSLAFPSSWSEYGTRIGLTSADRNWSTCSRMQLIHPHPPPSLIQWFGDSLSWYRWSSVNIFMIFWKLRTRPFKWCHQSSSWEIKVFAYFKKYCYFGDTMDYSPWSKAEKWQIRAPTKCWIKTHNLKGLLLSFQKIQF